MIRGIDLSAVQGKVTPAQWALVKARGTAFAIARCGVGNDGVDLDWVDILDARAEGLTIGVYHFCYVGLPDDPRHPGRDPVSQAQSHFTACAGLGSDAGELPACFDLEWPSRDQWGRPIAGVDNSVVTPQMAADWAGAYGEEYARLQGRTPLLYSDPYWLEGLPKTPALARFRLWLAAYGPSVPPVYPWAGWTLWQTAGGSAGRMPDGAPVDTDECEEATFGELVR